ncbi:MAG: hypothetical protein WBB04_07405 [Candidatus Macondimonas sp.]
MADSDKSLDIFGTKPLSEAAKIASEATFHGVGEFLSRICLPAAEELGLLLRDKVSALRRNNAMAIAAKAKEIVDAKDKPTGQHAHPRIVVGILEHGSWSDDDEVQGMWAGLLASACTANGKAQENLIYVSYLAQITTSQAKILNLACEKATKKKTKSGLLISESYFCPISQVSLISGNYDLHSIDLELDHLRSLGLLESDGGLRGEDETNAVLSPSALALKLYVRCQGYVGSPTEYFGL